MIRDWCKVYRADMTAPMCVKWQACAAAGRGSISQIKHKVKILQICMHSGVGMRWHTALTCQPEPSIGRDAPANGVENENKYWH